MKVIPYSNTYGNVVLSGKTPEDILLEELGAPYEEYRRRWHDANSFKYRPSFPIHLDIETNYSCNLKCIMCPYGEPKYEHPDYKGKKIERKKIEDIIKKGAGHGLSSLRFSGLNEPLLYKELPELIGFATENKIIDIFMTTNGLLLTEKISYALIKAGLTHLMISLDAATPETYAKIRMGSNYDKVIQNIESFLKIRSSLHSRLPLLRLSFTKMQPNLSEVDLFIEKWTERVDYIAIAGYLRNIQNDDVHHGISLSKGTNDIKSYHCSQPWTRCGIFANGDVFPCCMNYGRKEPVGNIYESDIGDIWQSDKVRFIQDIHKAGEYYRHDICWHCIQNRDTFS